MQKIKTPIGTVTVDNYSKIVTEDEFNALSAADKSKYKYYITDNDHVKLLKICHEGNIVDTFIPTIVSKTEPKGSVTGTVWIQECDD